MSDTLEATTNDLKDVICKARETLRQLYTTSDLLTSTDKTLIQIVALLITALEKVSDRTESNIKEPDSDTTRTFGIHFPTVVLAIDDIWSDEDEVPENPTAQDVIDVLRQLYETPGEAASGWMLIDKLFVQTQDEVLDWAEWDDS